MHEATQAIRDGRRGFAFVTLGCKVNRVESDQIAAALLGRGATLVPEDDAAVVVINTCTVTGEADRKVRKAVRHALSRPARPVVVVTGCLAALDSGGLSALGERVVVAADKERVADHIAALLGLPASEIDSIDAPNRLRVHDGFRTRVPVKIEDGCDAFCAYCIVPFARGGPRSVPLPQVVAEVEGLVDAGVAEVVLTGINLGRYHDAGSCAGLPEVVAAVAATGIRRIRLSSIEPGDLTPDLLAVLASTPAVCEHLHVPLQSGSDRVLEAMGRPYTVAEYGARIERARAALPGLALTTDVITGFPGESDAEAAEALATIGELGFSRLHVFRFSPRDGTVAAGMAGRLGPAVIAERARELRALDARTRAAFAAARIGTTVEVLVERVTREGSGAMIASGTTREYLTLTCAAGGRSAGDIAVARAVSLDGVSLRGEWA